MSKNPFIVSERNRPFWQIPIAALFFTASSGCVILAVYQMFSETSNGYTIGHLIEYAIYLFGLGTAFCFQKSVYIDIENSRFRSTFEIGPIKLGQWKTINNYEYVSVFQQPLKDGETIFEVNLWYDTNKHWELYEKDNPKDAFMMGYEISELLNIDLLDATIPNDHKWIDKNIFKKTHQI